MPITRPMAEFQENAHGDEDVSSFMNEVSSEEESSVSEGFIRLADYLKKQPNKKPNWKPGEARPYSVKWKAIRAYAKQKAQFPNS